jgi:hypothetical protein
MQEFQILAMPLSAMNIAPMQRSIVALKRHEWFRVLWWGHAGSCKCHMATLSLIVPSLSALLVAAVSSIQLEVCLNKNPKVFNLRLLTHVHQISVAITHGRWNRKRTGPRK